MSIVKVLCVKGYLTPLTSKDIKYIDRLGVEFEGVWESKPENIHVDESVRYTQPNDVDDQDSTGSHNCHTCVMHKFKTALCLSNPDQCRAQGHEHCEDNCDDINHCDSACILSCSCAPGGLHIGECISAPCTIEEMRAWVAQYAPDKVNRSCGLHVHVSMKNQVDYNRLMDKAFNNFFVNWIKNWGEDMGLDRNHSFWERIEGKNKYCRKEHRANEQAAQTVKNANGEHGMLIRRCQLNFCYNIPNPDGSPRHTLECRVFPAFQDPAYIMSAIENLVRCVEEYLTTTENKGNDFKLIESYYEHGQITEEQGEIA